MKEFDSRVEEFDSRVEEFDSRVDEFESQVDELVVVHGVKEYSRRVVEFVLLGHRTNLSAIYLLLLELRVFMMYL